LPATPVFVIEQSGFLLLRQKKGKSLEGRYEAVSKEMIPLFYEGLSERQIDEFENLLRHILSNLIKYEEEHK